MYITCIAIIVIILDRITKMYISSHFALSESMPVIPSVFHITYIMNKGAAFGILENQHFFFLGIVLLLLGIIFYFRKKISLFPLWAKTAIGLLLGGALGNAYDRFTYKGVIDFLDFRIWPIFNVADIGITVGVCLLVLYLWNQGE